MGWRKSHQKLFCFMTSTKWDFLLMQKFLFFQFCCHFINTLRIFPKMSYTLSAIQNSLGLSRLLLPHIFGWVLYKINLTFFCFLLHMFYKPYVVIRSNVFYKKDKMFCIVKWWYTKLQYVLRWYISMWCRHLHKNNNAYRWLSYYMQIEGSQ